MSGEIGPRHVYQEKDKKPGKDTQQAAARKMIKTRENDDYDVGA